MKIGAKVHTCLFTVDVLKQQTLQMLKEQRGTSAHSVNDHIQDVTLQMNYFYSTKIGCAVQVSAPVQTSNHTITVKERM
jgi:hypothetical protein